MTVFESVPVVTQNMPAIVVIDFLKLCFYMDWLLCKQIDRYEIRKWYTAYKWHCFISAYNK